MSSRLRTVSRWGCRWSFVVGRRLAIRLLTAVTTLLVGFVWAKRLNNDEFLRLTLLSLSLYTCIVSPIDTAAKESIKREISVEIPAAEVVRETELQIQRYQKSARLPGFRAGHVPASIIKQRFGDGLENDVAEALIPKYFRRETDKLGLIPVSQPRVTDLHIHDGEPLTFKASFEVLPEIQVEGYKDLRADKPEISVTAEE